MKLILSVQPPRKLANGALNRFEFDGKDGIVGRDSHVQWRLPDAKLEVSGEHFDIIYTDEVYYLRDRSTNGTAINGRAVKGKQRLRDGDWIEIPNYRLAVRLEAGMDAFDDDGPGEEDFELYPDDDADNVAEDHTGGSGDHRPGAQGPVDDDDAWPEFEEASGGGRGPDKDRPPGPSRQSSTAYSEPEDGANPFGKFLRRNKDFFESPGGADGPPPPPGNRPPPTQHGPDSPEPDELMAAFISGLGLAPDRLKMPSQDTLRQAGYLLRKLTEAMRDMVEKRAKAKEDMRVNRTQKRRRGNNPLKFARSVDEALVLLLNVPSEVFMPAEQAVADASNDIQAHQMATLMAMEGALDETLERFSPEAIRERNPAAGVQRFISQVYEANLWRAYEQEFDGVVRNSGEFFLEIFTHEFRQAYQRQANRMRSPAGGEP